MAKVIKHPDFDPGTHKNDLALLMLSSPVNFTDYIRPVCLAAYRSFFVDGLSCWVTGWGAPQTHGEENRPGLLWKHPQLNDSPM